MPVKRNSKRIFLENPEGKFTYSPDFIVNDQFIELKGFWHAHGIRKIKACHKAGIEIHMIFEEHLKHFEKTGELKTVIMEFI